jgi:hypothetical protein
MKAIYQFAMASLLVALVMMAPSAALASTPGAPHARLHVHDHTPRVHDHGSTVHRSGAPAA